MLIESQNQRWVLDTKWKRLNASDRENKFNLSQSDFYQLFAYGQKYLEGKGEMALIFPMSKSFDHPLPPFYFDEGLILHVLPFDLERRSLVDGGQTTLPFRGLQLQVDSSNSQKMVA